MKAFPKKYNNRQVEADLQELWANSDAFKWDMSLDKELDYVIDTPPPTVSGTLHVGHVYSYTQTDIIARYFRMKGKNVLYPIGWDDNGLPTERLVEKVKKVRGGTMDREAFVDLCREVIPEYHQKFRSLFSHLGLSVDWSREYQTISDESQKLSQLSFLDLYDKGLLVRRLEPTLWDPADRTAIAQAEIDEMERTGLFNTIEYKVDGADPFHIATTRPEYIAACGGIMIHPDHPRAKELIGKTAITPLYNVRVPIIAEETVDPEKGTGIVQCCTFGDVVDIQWWREHNLPLRIVIEQNGRMKDKLAIGSEDWPSDDIEKAKRTVEALAGLKLEQARKKILELLDEEGVLIEQKETEQVVPIAERSGAPLEIIVTAQWFIRTIDFKDEIKKKGQEITWHPPYMYQRFESWVEGIKWDWAISRQRHFGVPIPVWYSKREGEEGKILVPEANELPINPLTYVPKGYSADEIEPETDVLDTWATSSVSPQLVSRTVSDKFGDDHELHSRLFPNALRPQAHDIIRTWAFYTIVKALHHEQKLPWETIAISGWCLASDGSKMSKSKGNIIDPIKMLNEYGADAVRYWTGTSRLGHDTRLAADTLKQGKRLVTKLWNAVKLSTMTLEKVDVNVTTITNDIENGKITHPIDIWVLEELAEIVKNASENFENYEYAHSLRLIEDFFWRIYCDNYLEIVKNRSRIDEEPITQDNISAAYTLYHTANTLIKLFAPFLPYVTETLNDILNGVEGEVTKTVHARNMWPKQEEQAQTNDHKAFGRAFIDILAAGRRIKSELEVSIKTPVQVMTITPKDDTANIEELLGRTALDLKSVLSVETIQFGAQPEGLPFAPSPSENLIISMDIAEK